MAALQRHLPLSLEDLHLFINTLGVGNAGLRFYRYVVNACYKIRADSFTERLASQVIPDEQFWHDLLKEVKSSTLDGSAVLEFLKVAVSCCPSVAIAKELTAVAVEMHEDDQLETSACRDCFNMCLQICGQDIYGGADIHNAYREFEVEVLEDLVDTDASEQDIESAKTKLVKVIHSQMAQPLVGNEEALQAISVTLGENFKESEAKLIRPEVLSKNYSSGLEKRAARLLYEDYLQSAEYKESSLQKKTESWRGYIAFEVKEKEIGRAERLYQRSVMAIPTSVEMWKDAICFMAFTLKNMVHTCALAERATRVFPAVSLFHKICVLTLESIGSDIEHINNVVSRALYCGGLTSVEEYLDVLLMPCDYYFRQIRKHVCNNSTANGDKVQELISSLQQGLNNAAETLRSYYPDWIAGHLRVCKYQCLVNEFVESTGRSKSETSSDNNAKNEIWEQLTKLQGKSYFVWCDYAKWAIERGRLQLARGVFKRGVGIVDEFRLEVCKEWYQFECLYGTIPDLLAAIEKIHKVESEELAKQTRLQQQQLQQQQLQQQQQQPQKSGGAAAQSGARNHGTEVVSGKRKLDQTSHAENSSSEGTGNEPKRKHVSFDEKMSASASGSASASAVEEISNKSKVMVSVSNLPFNLSESELVTEITTFLSGTPLVELFPNLLHSLRMSLVLTKANKSRGIVNIHMPSNGNGEEAAHHEFDGREQEIAAQLVMLLDKQTLCGRTVVAQVCDDDTGASKTAAGSTSSASSHHPTTVYVSKLPLAFSKADMEALFVHCGRIVASQLSVDKKTGISKGHGLVQFETENAKYAALRMNRMEVKDSLLCVLPSKFGVPTHADKELQLEQTAPAPDPMDIVEKTDGKIVNDGGSKDVPQVDGAKPAKSNPKPTALFKPRKLR